MLQAFQSTALTRLLGCFLGVSWLLVASRAHAWGDEGHRVVGELAFRYLSPTAQAAVSGALTEPGYETLAEAATWPDTFARRFAEYDPMKPFHYVNVDAGAAHYSRQRDCPTGCIVTALTQFIALAESRDPPLTPVERRRSIYWIAHFMGDLHQPLHVAHPDGKGGSATLLRFFDAKEPRNAHWMWDVGLIERRPPPASGGGSPASAQPSYRALADELAAGITPATLQAFRRMTEPEAIANESLAVSRRYAFLESDDTVDAAYELTRRPIVTQQLQKASVRLAAVLERGFGKERR